MHVRRALVLSLAAALAAVLVLSALLVWSVARRSTTLPASHLSAPKDLVVPAADTTDSGVLITSLVATKQLVMIGTATCTVAAVNPDTGAVVWVTQLNSVPSESCAVSSIVETKGGVVAGTSTGSLHSIDPETGLLVWTTDLAGYGLGTTAASASTGASPVLPEIPLAFG